MRTVWFSAMLRFVTLVERVGGTGFSRSVIVFRAEDFSDAKPRAVELGRGMERSYKGGTGKEVPLAPGRHRDSGLAGKQSRGWPRDLLITGRPAGWPHDCVRRGVRSIRLRSRPIRRLMKNFRSLGRPPTLAPGTPGGPAVSTGQGAGQPASTDREAQGRFVSDVRGDSSVTRRASANNIILLGGLVCIDLRNSSFEVAESKIRGVLSQSASSPQSPSLDSVNEVIVDAVRDLCPMARKNLPPGG
jgi:hypothetical protein